MDFSGYSDIAIGCAKCLGYDLDHNFNLPYISNSITDFWRRWHISLSSWFKDYVYIPLGGNKKGKLKQSINLLIVMTLSGLWHGANWNYLIWGLLNGILLCIEKILSRNKTNKVISTMISFILISFTWVFFKAESIDKAFQIFSSIFTLQNGIRHYYIWSYIYIIVTIVVMFYISKRSKEVYLTNELKSVKDLTLFFILIGMIVVLGYFDTNPFIYFKF